MRSEFRRQSSSLLVALLVLVKEWPLGGRPRKKFSILTAEQEGQVRIALRPKTRRSHLDPQQHRIFLFRLCPLEMRAKGTHRLQGPSSVQGSDALMQASVLHRDTRR